MSDPIVIAGAGIGGLATAIALRERRFQVTIIEQSPSFGEIGAGLQLSPNAISVLDLLGVKEQVIQQGVLPNNAILKDYKSGPARLTVPLNPRMTSRYGNPFVQIHRADLHQILVQRALDLGAAIELGAPFIEFSGNLSDNLYIQTEHDQIKARALIGADGIKSKVRQQLYPDFKPRFTKNIAWRATIKAADVAPGTLSEDTHLWLGPGRHLVAYYIRRKDLINLVGVQECYQWTDENWSLKGSPEDLRAAFSGWTEPVPTLLSAVKDVYKWGLFDHAPLNDWHQGRVTLLGDAAHAMLPFMAQGAAAAIEDGYFLASCLEISPNIIHGFQFYETLRKLRTSRLQKRSRQNAKLYHAHTGPARIWRDLQLFAADKLPFLSNLKFDYIYGYKPDHILKDRRNT